MPDWKDFLSTIPIFSFLTPKELKDIQDHFIEVTFQKGETVCEIGDPGDMFFVVLSGELEVWGGETEFRRTGTLSARDFFGEMALMQGGKRTATVIAGRRTRALALDKASFDRFFVHNPRALEYFARVLCKRLASVTRGDTGEVQQVVVGVGARKGLVGTSLVAGVLSAVLKKITGAKVLLAQLLDRAQKPKQAVDELLSDDLEEVPEEILKMLKPHEPLPSILSIGARRGKTVEYYGERAANLTTKLAEHFPLIVLDLGSHLPELVKSAGSFCDFFIEVSDDPEGQIAPEIGNSTKTFTVVNLYNPSSQAVPISDCEPFILPKSPVLFEPDAAERIWKEPLLPEAIPFYRLARKILGTTVGVALGGGAAFGISHLGVLKVLLDNNIPIDLVAGCSQGSIIGVGFASGISVDEMIGIAAQLGQKKNFFMAMDFSFMGPGFLAGKKMIDVFRPYLHGKETFEDLVYPCRTIATDIESGERIAIGSGRLDDAFRASSAVPMVFEPHKQNGRALVDGGVTDPVPAEIIQEMGADICIAVNVVPPLRKGVTTVMNRAYKQLSRFNPLSYVGTQQDLPNMFDIVMNSMQILQYELGNFKAISADVLINPDLTDFTWIEYYRSQELIDRGVEAAERALPAIEKVLTGKLAPYQQLSGSS